MDQSRTLQRLREEALMTIAELSARSGVSEDTISKIENGHRKGRSITLRKLTTALGVTPETLLPGNDPHPATRGAGRAHPTLRSAREERSREFDERLSEARAAMEQLAQFARGRRDDERPDPVDALEYAEGRRRALDSVVREGAVFGEGPNEEERRLVAAVAVAAGLLFEDLTARLRR